MSTVKLTADSGGGTVAIAGPSTTTGNAALTLTLPGTASGTIVSSKTAGRIIQVVSSVKSDVTSWSSATSKTDTGLSATITPSSSSNKILMQYVLSVGWSGGNMAQFTIHLIRGSTEIGQGDAGDSTQKRAHAQTFAYENANYLAHSFGGSFLDSPSTTSATTYKLQVYNATTSGTTYINRTARDGGYTHYDSRLSSNLILMEVSA